MSQHDQETYWKWIQACMDCIDDWDNDWEIEFIKSLHFKMERNRSYFLSPRQVEILERIYAKNTK